MIMVGGVVHSHHKLKMSNTVLKSQSILLIFVTLLSLTIMLPCPCAGKDYYVKPSTESGCPDDDQLYCKTLDEYANNTKDLNGDVTLLFMAGVHNLTTELVLANLVSLKMRPTSDAGDKTDEKVTIQLFCKGLVFTSISQGLTIQRLTISSKREKSQNLVLKNSPATLQQLHVIGVGVLIMTAGARKSINVTITDSNLEKSKGTGLQVSDGRLSGTFNLLVKDSNISHHLQGGIIINSSSEATLTVNISGSVIHSNNITISESASANAAGLSVYSSRSNSVFVYIRRCYFVNNRDMRVHLSGASQDLKGNSMVMYVLRAKMVNISDSEFRDNRGTAVGAVNVERNVRLYGNIKFVGNTAQQGGALSLVSTLVSFMPYSHVSFVNNSADNVGGAIFIVSALSMYEDNDPNTCDNCFYSFPEWEQSKATDYSLIFSNNSARNGGHHIYGASLMSYCVVYDNTKKGDTVRSRDVQSIFRFDKQLYSPVSSNPSRVCIINEAISDRPPSEHCADKSQIFKTHTAFPGEKFQFNAILTGAEFGTGTGAVYAQFLPNGDNVARLQPLYQYSQRIAKVNTSQPVEYTLYSNNPYEVLVLTAVDITVLSNGDDDEIEKDINKYKEDNVIPSLLLTTPVYINVTLSECPSGFYLHSNSLGCECNPALCNAQVTSNLSNGSGLVYLGESVWVDAYSNVDANVSGIILHKNCPFDYCNVNSSGGIDLNDSDTQCAMNHAGVLCGGCETGFSLAIGSNNCLPCHDSNGLSLLIFFATAGFLLVLFIKFLNMTVSQGTINGLIFYANIIWMYQDIFFPNLDVVHFKFCYVFLAWINLDFGIETCFIKGLTAFWRTWLQFLFPLYIWSIAGGIIFVAHRSKRMTKVFGNNSVPVLATLFLLSYANLLRTVITVLYPANLYVYKDNGEPVKSLATVVWALDGTLRYGRVPHIFLLVVVVLIVIPLLWAPYTFCLLFIRSLRRHSGYRCFRWINRWKPFFDAYVGPLNPSNHHWVGLLLLARFVLLFVFTITYADDPFASLLSLVIVIVLLLMAYTGRLYDNPTTFNSRFLPETVSFRSILEVSFLFNLAVISVITLYLREDTTSKEVVVSISVGIAFIQFCGIVVFHIVTILKNKICKTSTPASSSTMEYENLEDEQDIATAPTTSSVNMGNKSSSRAHREYIHASYESARYREPILTESTA